MNPSSLMVVLKNILDESEKALTIFNCTNSSATSTLLMPPKKFVTLLFIQAGITAG
jgi:hypothetical protein